MAKAAPGLLLAVDEIGQKISNTGNMDFGDIMYGLVGFLIMFGGFCILRGLWFGICKWIAYARQKKEKWEENETSEEEECS